MSARSGIAPAVLACAGLVIAACGDDDDDDARGTVTSEGASSTATAARSEASVTLVAYESFPTEGSPVNDALAEFTATTGIDVEILIAGDTGTMVSKAQLTAGNPEGDVMFGVDNTFLSRALDAGVFEPYEAEGLDDLDPALVETAPGHDVTPVDFGDVCVNYDVGWFEQRDLAPPATFDDLVEPAYADLLVVENPATSSPGLAFLLATITAAGEDGWQDYWRALDANGVEVVDGWTEAYYEQFSWAGGDRPLVVSYGSSPPYEVLAATPPPSQAPTAVLDATCFRQVEFAGVLRGTESPEAARRLVDFLISDRFQRDIALNLFVFPANTTVELDPAFEQYAVIPDDPLTMDPETIGANRAEWTDEWTSIVLG
jgi:thiamine transport system substrate-binding protein